MKPVHRSFRWTASLALVLLVAACNSDSNDIAGPVETPLPPLTSGTVVVDRSAALLTAVGQSQQLSVQARNDVGAPVNAAVAWTSIRSAPRRGRQPILTTRRTSEQSSAG